MYIHNLNPVFLSIGPLEIRYYGLVYFFGFLAAWMYFKKSNLGKNLFKKDEHTDDFLLYTLISSIVSARIFYIIFYNLNSYITNPIEILKFWHGGMSIHGGILGGLLGIYLFAKKHNYNFLSLTDIVTLPLTLFLALGRIANFINAELYGRIASVKWAVKFPNAEGYRHPSQIYESIKNFFIFFVLIYKSKKPFKTGELTSIFLILYSILRFFVEYVREPEHYILGLTMGQFLSIFTFIIGIWLYRKVKQTI
ncbi:prolipoprotein diacylglyceryl transferase [Candidatus Woesearchaeota archaeon]|jgi:phosphatidylglycerol---prolipoprotein diacylglyceryl transferase|nr:prolipoprotein diacylglyceryl transferase [Candidatus Woesearchaeota archaeon]MBT6045151.1 prolipoprotein diacylglyceryl transferase [Candidatus Woesearchaeota archaeon]